MRIGELFQQTANEIPKESYGLSARCSNATETLSLLLFCWLLKNRFDFTRLAELDCQFRKYAAHKQPTMPRAGWVKTIRLAIGMSSDTLGNRVGISGQGLRKLEMSEADRSITLKTLDRLADALDCDVHYILAPRTSLVDQLIQQARKRSVDRSPSEYSADPVDSQTSPIGEALVLLRHISKRGFWQHPGANSTGDKAR